MPHKLVHPNNCPSVDIKEDGRFAIAILKIRNSLDGLFSNGAPQVLANYALQNISDIDANRISLNRLIGALLDENPISRILNNIDPFDKQNMLTLALYNYELPDEYLIKIESVNPKSSDQSSSPTYRIRRSTPCPKDFINR